MRYLHTMVRVEDVDASMRFYCELLGMKETRRIESEKGRFTLIYLAPPADEASAKANKAPELELTYNWDPESYSGGRNFGHLAYEVDDIYALCQKLMDAGITINRPPYGVCPFAGRYFDRISAKGRKPCPGGALGQHGKYRFLVMP